MSLYATTCEELYEKKAEAKRQVEEIIFHREHPTVAEYCEKWLLMQSAKVSAAILKGHENSKTTMDIYVKVKYNKPEELFAVVNGAFHQPFSS